MYIQAVQTALRKLESGCSIQDVKAFCDPDDLKQLFKWKIVDKLHWYVQNSDTIVDFCCGANDFSILMKKKLEENGKKCSYRNYDLLPTKNDFSFERRDWMTVQPTELPTGSQLIMGLNPPFGHKAALANKFVDKALEFKPKLVILIVPPETERLDKKQSPYDLIWEDENFLSGTSFYLPGSVDRQMDQRNARPPLLSLWSRPDWTTKHKVIAQENGHVCSQHEVLDTTDHTTDGNYAANLKSTDNQEDQASTSEGQKRILHYGNSQLNPIKGKSSGEGLKPKSDEVGDVVPGHGPSWGHSRNNNEQVVSETESSCKTNTPAIGQCEPCLGNLNHVMRSSLVSEPRTFSTSGSLGRSVPQSRYGGGGLLGFASGPNYAYASQHSCGWLEE